jgi:hypothetical protein
MNIAKPFAAEPDARAVRSSHRKAERTCCDGLCGQGRGNCPAVDPHPSQPERAIVFLVISVCSLLMIMGLTWAAFIIKDAMP